MLTINGFLSVRTNSRGQRVWAAFAHNAPLCADNTSLADVLAVARSVFGRATLAVWDGDKGEYTSELDTEEN